MAACERCGSTGFEIVSRQEREYAQRCVCQTGGAGGDALLTGCRIPPRYEHCSFENFEAGGASLTAALEKCVRYCAGYPYVGPTDEGLGLLFTGNSGVGKTHLAVAVMRHLVVGK